MVGVDMSYLCVATGQNLSVFVLLINCTSERTSTADVCVTLICFYFCFFCRSQISVLQKARFKLSPGDRKWLVWKGKEI